MRFSGFKMSLKYIFFNFTQLKLSVAYDNNFAADKISCQTSVYGLITFSKGKKKGRRNKRKNNKMQQSTFQQEGFLVMCYLHGLH